jgi:hypothetical protein
MTLATALRTPYRCRTLVRANAARVTDTGLRRAIAAMQAVLVALCGARVATDWVRCQATLEGALALVLFVVLAVRLAAKVFTAPRREEAPLLGDSPYRSSSPRTVAQKGARAR